MVAKGKRLLIGTVAVYALLVATHKGEFWPLSIYPMFSQAGHPWTRALARNVTAHPSQINWNTMNKQQLPGKPFAMNKIGINQNDLANFIHKNKTWSPRKIHGLRKYFMKQYDQRNFLVFKVIGRISKENPDSVAVDYIPYIFIRNDTTIFNPQIFDASQIGS